MMDKDVVRALMELDEKRFINIGRVKPHSGDIPTRLLLLEMGFRLMDESDMGRFRENYSRARELKDGEAAGEDARRVERLKREFGDAVEKVRGRVAILGSHPNTVVNGLFVDWVCPGCGEKQRIDLTKSEDSREFLSVNGKRHKWFDRRRGGAGGDFGPRIMQGIKVPGRQDAMPIAKDSGGATIVSMPAGPGTVPVKKLAGGEEYKPEFGCTNRKCGFRNKEIVVVIR